MDKQINKRIGLVIQARMKSKRLPGKVLLSLPFTDGIPLLGYIISTLKNVEGRIVVATSVNKENDAIYDFCIDNDMECYRGDEDNVLSRFVEIQKIHNFDYIVRLTADNPFVDSKVIESVIQFHIEKGYDYTSSSGLPLGMNIEVFNGKALIHSMEYIQKQQDNEHVTLILKREGIFNKGVFLVNEDIENLRMTVDTVQDYLLANIIAQIQKKTKYTGIALVKHINKCFPWIFEGNKEVIQKNSCIRITDEVEMAVSILEKLEFEKSAALLKNVSL